uniref:Putative kolobok-8 hm n=1 Tax=Amblyomma sculptum TaxID=1581419 RepID=A0A1E1XP14_AMBSC
MSATERKFTLTALPESDNTPASEDEYVVIQMGALNSLIGAALCPICRRPSLAVDRDTRLGLAVKMVLKCSCGFISSEWSSQRKQGARAFDVNLRSVQAIRSIGKGPTSLNDFWAVMNVSHRGLHQKTYQGHLKKVLKPAAEEAAQTVFAGAVEAVKDVYKEMDVTFTKNITVVYNGTWLTRGHSSQIGVGCVIEFYTGLVLDCTVLSNFCLGCEIGPTESDAAYHEWKAAHQCQKNIDVSARRMEVEAALQLFGRSLDKNDLRYTNVICDGDSRTYLALCNEQIYGFIPLTKEDCVNHVQKRMGTALRSLVNKAKKGEALGGKGGLTQDVIKRLTSYYGLALRSSTNVEEMQRAVMATLHHISSTDAEPHHDLCPPGARSWCRHRAAEAEGKPQPPHKYNLPSTVVEALLPVYQRLSDPQLLARCSGNKTQNAAESLHSVIWTLISKQQHASLFSVEAAVHEAVARYNAGSLRAYTELCNTLGVKPGALALRRAAEKDYQRAKKSSRVHEIKGQRPKKSPVTKDSENYCPGAF